MTHAVGILLIAISFPAAQNRDLSRGTDTGQLLPRQRLHAGLSPTTYYFDEDEIDSFIVETMEDYRMVGFAALVVKDTQIVWSGNYGYANLEQNQAVTDSTQFMIASISKTIVATALMQLWEQGLFGLDDDINDYLPTKLQIVNPSYPSDSITFAMLLTHTSSIADNWDVIDPLYVPGESPVSLDSFLVNYLMPGGIYHSASSYSPWRPGTTFYYCNVAFDLIGHLVETISGMAFPQYCQEHIFNPLAMGETSWSLAGLDTSFLAMPYQWDGSNFITGGHYSFPGYPSGLLWTSTSQLANFLMAYLQSGQFNGQSILDSTTIDSMLTVRVSNSRDTHRFGLCWYFPNEVGKGPRWRHDGGDLGAKAGLVFSPEENWGMIGFSNTATYSQDASYQGYNMIMHAITDFASVYDRIYAHDVHLESPFMQIGNDTLSLVTRFVNRQAHDFTANLIITSLNYTYVDSLPLYDDGAHLDGVAGDGIWGNQIIPLAVENTFGLSISTLNATTGGYFVMDEVTRFTTIGPVEYDNYRLVGLDTIPNPGERIYFYLTLTNHSATAPATTIRAEVTSLDTCSTVIRSSADYGDLAAGEAVEGQDNNYYGIMINDRCSGDHPLEFALSIQSDGYALWSDSFSVQLYPVGIVEGKAILPAKFALHQNYPNPFNPVSTIRYELPHASNVSLVVYDILGREVARLVETFMEPGVHHVQWGGREASGQEIPSGIYIARLLVPPTAGMTPEYSKSIKMVLLK